jgi:hypothetical protein
MTLLSLDQIRSALSERFQDEVRDFPDAFAALVPKPAQMGVAEAIADRVAADLGAVLPSSLLDALREWSFGQLRIGSTAFCVSGDYGACLTKYNAERPRPPWWGDITKRPANLLKIADGDPYTVLVDIGSGEIRAYAVDESFAASTLVAPNLSMFLRGLGTVEVRAALAADLAQFLEELLDDLHLTANCRYWRDLAHAASRA